MFFKKKKLLNVKYKRTVDSVRLLDKQFSITDHLHFKINIKDVTYYFYRRDSTMPFQITLNVDVLKGTPAHFGRTVKIKHRDGTFVYFTLHEDFLYSIDYDTFSYASIICLCYFVLFGGIHFFLQLYQNKNIQISNEKEAVFIEEVQRYRVTEFLNSSTH